MPKLVEQAHRVIRWRAALDDVMVVSMFLCAATLLATTLFLLGD